MRRTMHTAKTPRSVAHHKSVGECEGLPGLKTTVARVSCGITSLRSCSQRYSVETLEEMRKVLLGYRDNMRVELGPGIAIAAKNVADLRAPSWQPGLILNIHVDLDPRFSVVRVERS
jgi:hypothetical protein